jgi:hypothetical protein
MCALLNSRTAAAITLSRVNTCIGASDWGVNGEAALQDCDKRRSEKIAAPWLGSQVLFLLRKFFSCFASSLAVDNSVNNLVACTRRS